jgi:hypothetical protein
MISETKFIDTLPEGSSIEGTAIFIGAASRATTPCHAQRSF